jgi:hypothetical protein
MAKRRTNQQRSGRQAPKRQTPRFVFEDGEKSLPVPAATVAATVNEKGLARQYLPYPKIPEVSYLRVLGFEARCSLLGDNVRFLEGPNSVLQITRSMASLPSDPKEMPVLEAIGAAGSKVTMVATWRVLYKNH